MHQYAKANNQAWHIMFNLKIFDWRTAFNILTFKETFPEHVLTLFQRDPVKSDESVTARGPRKLDLELEKLEYKSQLNRENGIPSKAHAFSESQFLTLPNGLKNTLQGYC